MDNEQERGKNGEQEDVGRMMFKVERKQDEQKEKLRNGHERRRRGLPKEKRETFWERILETAGTPKSTVLDFFFLACLLFRSWSLRKCRA